MTVARNTFLDLVRQLISPDPLQRSRGADQVTDLVQSYSEGDVRTLCGILAAAAATEQNQEVMESQLHAILELSSTGYLHRSDVLDLQEIDRTEIPLENSEYIEDILER